MAVRCLSISASFKVWNLGWSLETTATWTTWESQEGNKVKMDFTSLSLGLKSADRMVDKQLIATCE